VQRKKTAAKSKGDTRDFFLREKMKREEEELRKCCA
jgi:hypothetical protein